MAKLIACSICKQRKPETAFSSGESKRRQQRCRTCRAEQEGGYRAANPEKFRARGRAHYVVNRAKIIAYQIAYYAANREKVCAREKARRIANPEKIRAQQRDRRAISREKIRAQQRAYYIANREKILAQNRVGSINKNRIQHEREKIARTVMRQLGLTLPGRHGNAHLALKAINKMLKDAGLGIQI